MCDFNNLQRQNFIDAARTKALVSFQRNVVVMPGDFVRNRLMLLVIYFTGYGGTYVDSYASSADA